MSLSQAGTNEKIEEMKIEKPDTVLITGASGGLGIHIVRAFARLGVRLALVAYPGNELVEIQAEVEKQGCESITIISDLRDRNERHKMVDAVMRRFKRVDILVNNAGIEFTSFYHELKEGNIIDVLSVNLEAPMLLTRMVLPQMLERRRGHVVNISSLAGKLGPAFQEPYSASKAALMAFTASLRATYRGSGFSASVIVPGFVEAGIYKALKIRTGRPAPALLGVLPPESVARAVIRAIHQDRQEIIVNQWPVRPLLALAALSPPLGQWIVDKIGSNDFFRRAVEAQRKC
jgi:short-subunit dehydrogenase